MRFMLLCVAVAVACTGCEFKAPSNPDEQTALPHGKEWPAHVDKVMQCLEKQRLMSRCVEMGPQKRMHGVWYTGFEESGFVPDVRTVPLERTLDGETPEYRTMLENDAVEALRELGLPEEDRCIRAVAIEFLGRRSVKPGPYYVGPDDELIAVDRLLGGRLIGRVRTRGLPGYDEQCATPTPSAGQLKAMDDADWRKCREAEQCITFDELKAKSREK